MSLDSLRVYLKHFFLSYFRRNRINILWHAGEPLTLPTSYYYQACDIIHNEAPSDIDLRFSIQTNGTLIDDDWCDFFQAHDIQVGLSLDGPEFLHDHYRITQK